nr:hypothetical protein [uncultured Sphingomonas sp.]
MRAWLLLLSGLIVWTAHFFAIYIAASVFPGSSLANWLTGLLTLVALALLAAAVFLSKRRTGDHDDDSLSRWLDSLALLGIALSAVAILYQGLPALTS